MYMRMSVACAAKGNAQQVAKRGKYRDQRRGEREREGGLEGKRKK
jgi:hypothetical protein